MTTTTTTDLKGAARKKPSKPIMRGVKTGPNKDTVTKPLMAPTRTAVLISLMRSEPGETAQKLAEAIGWQVHSVRGFISGTLKKRSDLEVITNKIDGITRYAVRDVVEGRND